MDTDDLDGELALDSVFTEPPRPPTPDPTFATYTRNTDAIINDAAQLPSEVKITLVGSHPLWGHYLWNAALSFASYLDANPELVRDRCVLELGAGGGLPAIVAAQNGAQRVVVTDYPDSALIENLTNNINANISSEARNRVKEQGYIWGQNTLPLFQSLPTHADTTSGFDLIIMSDLIFNHSQHDALLKTCDQCLRRPTGGSGSVRAPIPCLLVFYTHHRPHLAHRDLEFFTKARNQGWNCEEIVTEKFPPMFPEDPGEEEVRSTVHGWRLLRAIE
ncbi:putative methyltransferase-domain-containing protein [Hygrophoropsis aurantiaca]|uniref:Methyltransferase-domain-containing protein n=1 Tax=Hygrophoropsis aurantiaca TaxID=72124 RepID=A0ACB8A6Z2_9AGAM|nr:putative methyltransferase-domain-containing protein [Hygrophoropsis aurantiaca]